MVEAGSTNGHMSTPLRPRTSTAFYVQSAVSFAIALTVTIVGIASA